MAKKPAEYVHCTKCGYVGVVADHGCMERRMATAAQADEARAVVGVAGADVRAGEAVAIALDGRVVPATRALIPSIHHVEATLRGLLGRWIKLTANRVSGRVAIEQVCSACREAIEGFAQYDDDEIKLIAAAGAAAKKQYMRHRCKPIEERALSDFDDKELEQLRAELERDGTNMIKRAAEIEAVLKARA